MALGVAQGTSGDDSEREEALEAWGAGVETAISKERQDPLVRKGREAQEASVLTPLPVGSGPSLGPLYDDQWLMYPSGGRAFSPGPQN